MSLEKLPGKMFAEITSMCPFGTRHLRLINTATQWIVKNAFQKPWIWKVRIFKLLWPGDHSKRRHFGKAAISSVLMDESL